ncbi:MAG: TspO/MBR family protein [Devosiaceae bacterium]
MDLPISWSMIAFFAVTFVAALSGGYFRPGQWYRDLTKPSWNPPDFLFPIAWTILYGMMAFAAWIVWEAAGWPAAAVPIGLWFVQLVLNALWSALFFGLKRMDYALMDVTLMWIIIAATIFTFWPISSLAGWLMVPYLVWVSFAAFLNLTILRLNPTKAA